MRKFILFFIGCLFCFSASAQYNFYKLSIGGGAGAAMAFGDLKKNFIKPAGLVTFDYNFTPFVSLGLEIQKGFLSGGDSLDLSIDEHRRFFKNSFTSVAISGKAQLGEFVDLESSSDLMYALRGFYVGTGIGMINNSMTEIYRNKPRLKSDGTPELKPDGTPDFYTFPGKEKGTELFIPINTGISFNFVDQWRFTKFSVYFNYQMNMVLGESLDGYDDPPSIFKNKHGDFYGITSIGIKYHFGREGLY